MGLKMRQMGSSLIDDWALASNLWVMRLRLRAKSVAAVLGRKCSGILYRVRPVDL